MSIPKEPRQLMINLMYLVLTALLALNVSAEVMNAFFSLDKGMKDSGAIVDRSNEAVLTGINKQADAYKSEQNEKYRQNAAQAKTIADGFIAYVEGIRTDLFAKAGGPNLKVAGQPKDIRNKDMTTRMFITEGLGLEIQKKIEETRASFLALADGDKEVEASLPLRVEELPAGIKAKNWPEFKFKQMPVAAVFPILGKMQSDSKNSYSAILNYCAKKVGGEETIRFTDYEPVVSANKAYLIQGETYEADIFLGAYSKQADNIRISAGGTGLNVEQGKAHYTATASGLGEKKFNVNINVTNPLTKEVKTYNKEFSYEVGQRSIAVQLDKMNVFYIGVENPISVSAAGVSSNDVKVSASGVNVANKGGGHFMVTATTPGECILTVSAPNVSQKFTYRVKRIPDPTPLLGAKHRSKQMANGEFRAQGGIAAVLESFDFDAKCDIAGFEATYLPKRQDPISKQNSGARWNGDVQDMISKAKPGDAYFFDDIKCKCPGDAAARNLGGLAFKIR
ncbi:MAG: gliding motility protein GldM [Saprospiraceae bacterium]